MGQWFVLVTVVVSGVLLARTRPQGRRVWPVLWAVVSVALLVLAAGPYEVRKAVAALAMPLGWVWLGAALLALHLGRSGLRGPSRWAWALFVLVGLAGNVPLGVAAARLLERPFTVGEALDAGPFDAVVVLGGGLGTDRYGRPVLGFSGERVALGARLYLAGRTPLLVATGPVVRRGGREVSVAEATCRYWQGLGVPHEAVLTLTGPRTTRDEIRAVAAVARSRHWRRVGLVTSAWHLRRATRLARREGLDVTPLAADRLGELPAGGIRFVVPRAMGLVRTEHVAWELLGMAMGR